MTNERQENFNRVNTLLKKEPGLLVTEACKRVGIKAQNYYDLKSKLKKKTRNVKRASKIPTLVTLPQVDEQKKKPVTILIGDPDEIGKLLKQVGG